MNEPAQLLHNMSAPSSSIISYSGFATRTSRWRGTTAEPLVIAFRLSERYVALSPNDMLKEIGNEESEDPESTLLRLINDRANSLPLPDGCGVVECREEHAQIWDDLLAQLAIICKSSSSVWLRSKTTRLTEIEERSSVSLFLPFGIPE